MVKKCFAEHQLFIARFNAGCCIDKNYSYLKTYKNKRFFVVKIPHFLRLTYLGYQV